jgi:hypothetical protein
MGDSGLDGNRNPDRVPAKSGMLVGYGVGRPQPCGLKTRRGDGGLFASEAAGRIGRGTKFPPQLGQTPCSLLSTQSLQNVHSNVHIMASGADGGRFLSQHSQLGRNSSIGSLRSLVSLAARRLASMMSRC